MIHSFFSSQVRYKYLSLFSFYLIFTQWSTRTTESTIRLVLFYFIFYFIYIILFIHQLFIHFILLSSGLLDGIMWSVCISKPHRILCVSFSRTDSGLYLYHLARWSNFHVLRSSQWITLYTQSYLVLFSFCASRLHSFIMWLIVSFQSQHNLHLLFFCFLSIFVFTLLVLIAFFCADIKRDSISLSKLLFVGHLQMFSCEISFVCRLKYPYSNFSSYYYF